MKEIELTRGCIALVDDEDFERLSKWKWRVVEYFRSKYALRYGIKDGKSQTILMHRDIMEAGKGVCVDHKDKDGLNNQKENMRFSTVAQSQYGRRLNRNSTTGYKGVYWAKVKKRFIAQIYKNGERVHLGCFVEVIDAAEAYNQAAMLFFGEFARLNIIEQEKI